MIEEDVGTRAFAVCYLGYIRSLFPGEVEEQIGFFEVWLVVAGKGVSLGDAAIKVDDVVQTGVQGLLLGSLYADV